MKIHHIGIACSDIEEAIQEFSDYHTIVRKSEIIFDTLQNAKLCLINTDTGLDVEFISGEQVSKLVKKGINYYHICYEVDDLQSTIDNYLAQGAKLISESKEAVLFENRKVAFLYVSYGLIELLEK
jgi:methylmalonyl-CoA/ethylmalonyl-CoA epimerase